MAKMLISYSVLHTDTWETGCSYPELKKNSELK